eukprot:m.107199 g.107199  ORF g.107199 m.107199 type:complete len:400 (-) comp12738_c0_seq2:84-1283(-)
MADTMVEGAVDPVAALADQTSGTDFGSATRRVGSACHERDASQPEAGPAWVAAADTAGFETGGIPSGQVPTSLSDGADSETTDNDKDDSSSDDASTSDGGVRRKSCGSDTEIEVDLYARARRLLSRSATCREQTRTVCSEIDAKAAEKRRREASRRPETALTPNRSPYGRLNSGRKSLLPDLDLRSADVTPRPPGARPSTVHANNRPKMRSRPKIGQMEQREEARRLREEVRRRDEAEQAAAEVAARKEESKRAKEAMLAAQKQQRVEAAKRQAALRKQAEERERGRKEREATRRAELDALVTQRRPQSQMSSRSRRGSQPRRPSTAKLAQLPEVPKPPPFDTKVQELEEEIERKRAAEEAERKRAAEEAQLEEYSRRALEETRGVAEKRLSEIERRNK